MESTVSTPDSSRFAGSWMFRNLAVRRVLPFAILIFAWCLGLLSQATQAPNLRNPAYLKSIPFVGNRGAGVDYYQFWIVGRAQESLHPHDIYSLDDRQKMAELGREKAERDPSDRLAYCVGRRERMIETFSTPFLYAVVNGFGTGQFDGRLLPLRGR